MASAPGGERESASPKNSGSDEQSARGLHSLEEMKKVGGADNGDTGERDGDIENGGDNIESNFSELKKFKRDN